jgi:hypothetical protein
LFELLSSTVTCLTIEKYPISERLRFAPTISLALVGRMNPLTPMSITLFGSTQSQSHSQEVDLDESRDLHAIGTSTKIE